jgi:hypothetical protein
MAAKRCRVAELGEVLKSLFKLNIMIDTFHIDTLTLTFHIDTLTHWHISRCRWAIPETPYIHFTLLRLVRGPILKWPYGRFRGGLPTWRAACGRLLPPFYNILNNESFLLKCKAQMHVRESIETPSRGSQCPWL